MARRVTAVLAAQLPAIVALLLFGVCFLLPWDYCMDGTGWGFPFAWIHPLHEDEAHFIALGIRKFDPGIDFDEMAEALVSWLVLMLPLAWWARRRRRRSDAGAA